METNPNPNPNANHKSTIYAAAITGTATVLAAIMSTGIIQNIFQQGKNNIPEVTHARMIPDKKFIENKNRLDSLSRVYAKLKEEELKRTVRIEMMKNENMVADNSGEGDSASEPAGSN